MSSATTATDGATVTESTAPAKRLSFRQKDAAQRRQLASLASKIAAAHTACEKSMTDGLKHALEAGQFLLEAKANVKHGSFLKWVEGNCSGVSQRLAQRYMQIARAYPKLESSNASRVADLSFRDALHLVSKTTKQLEKIEPDRRQRVLEAAITSTQGASLSQRIFGENRRDIRKARADKIMGNEATLLRAKFPASWTWDNYNKLRDEVEQEEPFISAQRRRADLVAERDGLVTRLNELEKQIQELRDQNAIDIQKTIVQRHGRRHQGGEIVIRRKGDETNVAASWFAAAVEPEVYDRLAAMDEDAYNRLEEFARAGGYCPNCFTVITTDNAGCPDDPSKVHVWCNWCRDHRGKTHCDDCGRPLVDGEDFTCKSCDGDEVLAECIPAELGAA